jgi:hypothetical protein
MLTIRQLLLQNDLAMWDYYCYYYRVTDLTSSTDYTFIVKSKDEEDNLSAASNQETITTKPKQQQI